MKMCSTPSILISVPAYLEKRIRSPFFTSMAMRLPSSPTLPGPTATTLPSCGFSLAVSGMMIPPAVFFSSSTLTTKILSFIGLIFITPDLLRDMG